MQQTVYYILMFTSFVSALMFLLLSAWYWRAERRRQYRQAQTKADIADIMILFQTMRDVISQQKSLARDFNQELDRKMSLVKEVLAKSLEKNEKLYERQQELQTQIEELKAQIESAQRQTGYLRQGPAPAPKPPAPPSPTPSPPARPAPAPAAPVVEVTNIVPTVPPQPRLAPAEEERLAKTGLTDAPFSVWFGLDFDAAAAPAPVEEEENEAPAPRTPEDAEAARNAFRALLNMPAGQSPPPGAAPAPIAAQNPLRPSNGTPAPVPLQQRVLEYSEAGMGVAEIARELGIGKGEVRLMLSLAKQKGG